MSPDRVVYSFVLGWVLLITVLLVLDWLGNPNRGLFRPKGDRRVPDRRERRSRRRRTRAESDAAVRATLRDAYGASSLRLSWTRAREDAARRVDDSLVIREDTSDTMLDVASREVVATAHTVVAGDPLPNPREVSGDHSSDPARGPTATNGPEPKAGWTVGVHPLAPTRHGRPPTAATVRSRVWKNHRDLGAWDPENLERLEAGRPPRRVNPITGDEETARVEIGTGVAEWPGEAVDPFAAEP